MKMIAASDRRGGIGKNGGLLVHLPSDMKYFRSQTIEGTVIMGRKTLESFPGGKPLPKRTNIVISKTMGRTEGCEICRTPAEAAEMVSGMDQDKVFVIGGGQIYAEMLPYCDEALITEIDDEFDADTFIPVFSEDPDWECVSRSDEIEENGERYTWAVYRRKNK